MRFPPDFRLVSLLLCSAMGCTADSGKQNQRRPVETPPLGPYVGPLYETHLHIATFGSLEDSKPRYRVDLRDEGERDPELSVDAYIASMDRTGIACTLAFHSVAVEEVAEGGEVDRNSGELFGNAERIHAAHSDRIKLFAEIFRHNPAEWFDADRLRPVLEQGTFAGLGEFQLANPPFSDSDFGERNYLIYPNDPQLMEIYAMLSELGLPLMLHPGATEGLDEAISAYPDVPWIIHGWQVHDEWQDLEIIDALFAAHPNLYYTIDFAETLPEHLEIMKNRRGADLEIFQDFMEEHADTVAQEMAATWTPLIERWPDRFTWGTDIARPKWQWTEPEVLDAITEVSRAYLGTLPPEVAEQVAWKNAVELLGPCDELSLEP
ncbi:MAG TPA: hypothetical protein DFR83_25135 [Deltaproteobacteria bacterium]|nr:hypothetical protein [Deltaproteobacteria bacterium]